MSREDVCGYVYSDGSRCELTIIEHKFQEANGAHRFEPTRAEAPQGETPKCDHATGVCVGHVVEGGGRSWVKDHAALKAAAAQPETGDEGRVREIVKLGLQKWANGGTTQQGIELAVREALRVGRAAENEACEAIAAHEESIGTGTAEFISTRIRHAIAERRGGGR